jgi:hypothetical protein
MKDAHSLMRRSFHGDFRFALPPARHVRLSLPFQSLRHALRRIVMP